MKIGAAPDGSCCSLSNAPVPTTGQRASLSTAAGPVVVLDATWKVPSTAQHRPVQIKYSPPSFPLQSLLCKFLI
jgi:hypothetical protein